MLCLPYRQIGKDHQFRVGYPEGSFPKRRRPNISSHSDCHNALSQCLPGSRRTTKPSSQKRIEASSSLPAFINSSGSFSQCRRIPLSHPTSFFHLHQGYPNHCYLFHSLPRAHLSLLHAPSAAACLGEPFPAQCRLAVERNFQRSTPPTPTPSVPASARLASVHSPKRSSRPRPPTPRLSRVPGSSALTRRRTRWLQKRNARPF